MPRPDPILLENLSRFRQKADAARQLYDRQVEACIEAGYTSTQIAAAEGVKDASIRQRRVWKERHRG